MLGIRLHKLKSRDPVGDNEEYIGHRYNEDKEYRREKIEMCISVWPRIFEASPTLFQIHKLYF